jgi:RNA polymerase sigma-70 factor (ECF subfamily)
MHTMRTRKGEAGKQREPAASHEAIYKKAFAIGVELALNWVLADVAEDLAQKVAVELYWRLMKGEPVPDNLRDYVRRAVWFNSQKHYRRLQVRKRPFERFELKRANVQREWMHPQAALDLGVTEEKLQRALVALPKRQLELVQLIVFDGMAYDEAGEQMGIKGGTVRVQMARALKKLRRALLGRREETS